MNCTKKIMAYLFMPLFFLILSYGLLSILLKPIYEPYLSFTSLLQKTQSNQNKDGLNIIEASKEDYPESVSFNDIKIPSLGSQFGRVIIEDINLDLPLAYGDDYNTLNYSLGQYAGSTLPGLSKPTLIAGHTFPFFKPLITSLEIGSEIKVVTHYGAFFYEVTDTKIAHMSDTTVFDLTQNRNELILYTCYPAESLGNKTERFYVFATPTEGTKILGDPYEK